MYFALAQQYIFIGEFESAFRCWQTITQKYLDMGDNIRAAHGLSEESINALRYNSVEHARRTRLRSLALYQEAGLPLGTAWATWEMGEIERVAGNIHSAREWFTKAAMLFDLLEDRTSPIFIQRGLGDIAQVMGDYSGAKQHFQESLQYAEATNHRWAEVYALCGLGRAEVVSGDIVEAHHHCNQALETAWPIQGWDIVHLPISVLATIYMSIGNPEAAVECASWVMSHKLSWNETKSQMTVLLHSLSNLPPDRFLAAQERGQGLDIKEMIARIQSYNSEQDPQITSLKSSSRWARPTCLISSPFAYRTVRSGKTALSIPPTRSLAWAQPINFLLFILATANQVPLLFRPIRITF